MKTPITYYGGKQKLAPEIIPLLPEHKMYVEPFCGGAAVFFEKKPSDAETLNDTNGELINFYRIVQQDFLSLEKRIKITLHSRMEHHDALVTYQNPHRFSPVERAWAVWVLSHQSFCSSLGASFGYDMSGTVSRNVANKRSAFNYSYAQRLQCVQFECADAVKIIRAYDAPDTLFYCDPPYYNSDCGHYDGYTIEDYRLLLSALSEIEGKFLLSSYPSQELKKHTQAQGWESKEFKMRVSVAVGAHQKEKTEVLTA